MTFLVFDPEREQFMMHLRLQVYLLILVTGMVGCGTLKFVLSFGPLRTPPLSMRELAEIAASPRPSLARSAMTNQADSLSAGTSNHNDSDPSP